ncbi:MAG: SGNH/GDSL hydrolase family protein [Deltaproteobacteria bacterium]|nr:SGNH/GDSL hydrolase family protein [Deltaproteobacteria bacterium]
MKRLRGLRVFGLNSLLVIVSTGIALLVAEIVASILEPPYGETFQFVDPPSGPNPHFKIVGGDLGWEPVPGNSDPNDVFSMNTLGFRDRPMSARKEKGSLRVLVIGDSVAYGPGLELSQTFDNQLEDMLTKRMGRKVEAVNMGVPGYNSIQESLFLKKRGGALDPDLLIVVWTTNDPGGTATAVAANGRIYTSVPGELDMPLYLPIPASWQVFLFKRSALFRLACMRGVRLYSSIMGRNRVEVMDVSKAENQMALLDMAGFARSRGIGCLFVLFPAFDGESDADSLLEETANFLKINNLYYLDLRPSFKGVSAKSLRRFPDDPIHPSALACMIAAKTVAGYLVDNGIPGPVDPAWIQPRAVDSRPVKEIVLPEARNYMPAPKLEKKQGQKNISCSGMVVRYADPRGDNEKDGPDLVGFSAAMEGNDICVLIRLAEKPARGDRAVVQGVSDGHLLALTYRHEEYPVLSVQVDHGPELPLESGKVLRHDEVIVFKFPRQKLPPPFNEHMFNLGEVMCYSARAPEKITDHGYNMYEFGKDVSAVKEGEQ